MELKQIDISEIPREAILRVIDDPGGMLSEQGNPESQAEVQKVASDRVSYSTATRIPDD